MFRKKSSGSRGSTSPGAESVLLCHPLPFTLTPHAPLPRSLSLASPLPPGTLSHTAAARFALQQAACAALPPKHCAVWWSDVKSCVVR